MSFCLSYRVHKTEISRRPVTEAGSARGMDAGSFVVPSEEACAEASRARYTPSRPVQVAIGGPSSIRGRPSVAIARYTFRSRPTGIRRSRVRGPRFARRSSGASVSGAACPTLPPVRFAWAIKGNPRGPIAIEGLSVRKLFRNRAETGIPLRYPVGTEQDRVSGDPGKRDGLKRVGKAVVHGAAPSIASSALVNILAWFR